MNGNVVYSKDFLHLIMSKTFIWFYDAVKYYKNKIGILKKKKKKNMSESFPFSIYWVLYLESVCNIHTKKSHSNRVHSTLCYYYFSSRSFAISFISGYSRFKKENIKQKTQKTITNKNLIDVNKKRDNKSNIKKNRCSIGKSDTNIFIMGNKSTFHRYVFLFTFSRKF